MSNNIHAVQWPTKQSFLPAKGYANKSSLSVYRAHIHKHDNLTSFLPLEQIYDQVLLIFLSMQIGVTGLRTPLYAVRAG